MHSKQASLRLHAVGWVILSALGVSALNGVLCNSRPEKDPAMECCHESATQFQLGSAATEDCCQPGRGDNVLAEQIAARRTHKELLDDATTGTPLSPLPWSDHGRRQERVTVVQVYSDVQPHQPPVPLLI